MVSLHRISFKENDEVILFTNKALSNVAFTSGVILFFLMLVFPRTYQILKLPFLGICLSGSILTIILSGRIRIHKRVFMWFMVYIVYGMLWGLLGLFNGKDFAYDFIRLNVVWPLIYLILVSALFKEEYIEKLLKVMVWATLAISIYNINYFFYTKGLFHISTLVRLDAGQRIGIHEGYIQLTAHNIGTLNFLVPFLFTSIIINKRKKFVGFSSTFIHFVLIVSFFASFLTGRRMLWIIIVLSPFICFIVIYLSKAVKISIWQLMKFTVVIGLLLLIIQIIFFKKFGLDYQSFIERLTFSNEQKIGVIYRIAKSKILISEVCEKNLFFGTGGGSAAFEVTFIQIFHETGIFGLSIFLGLFLWNFINIIILLKRKRCKKEYGIPLLIGSMCFFISLSSNPYFGSFDFMWTLFLPIAFINICFKKFKVS